MFVVSDNFDCSSIIELGRIQVKPLFLVLNAPLSVGAITLSNLNPKLCAFSSSKKVCQVSPPSEDELTP